MTTQPEHGEPGHKRRTIDASTALAGILIHEHPDVPGALSVDAWAGGMSKRTLSDALRQLADEWESDADREDLEDERKEK